MAARAKKLTAAIATVVALVWCGANPLGAPRPRSGEDGSSSRGEPERLAPLQQSTRPVRRIVSLVPALTEMLFAVGAGSQVIGVSSYDDFPPEVQSRPRVGALLDPDVERILSLKPDLVVMYGSQTDLQGQFARAGIRVYSYRHGGISNVLRTIRELGALSGHQVEADRVAATLQAQLDAVRSRVRGRPRPRTMLVMGRDAMALRGIYVSAGVGFLHELLDVAGAEDVFADVKREGIQPSNETMIVRAPQVIIELHSGEPPAPDIVQKERSVWSLLSSVPAVRNGRVHLLYGGDLMSPGPRLAGAAERLARVLHPDAFAGGDPQVRP